MRNLWGTYNYGGILGFNFHAQKSTPPTAATTPSTTPTTLPAAIIASFVVVVLVVDGLSIQQPP